jgi:DNA-binding transcriptional ArsR family regulator
VSALIRSVSEIVDALVCGQSSVSKSLRVLREMGLVRIRLDIRRSLCRIHAVWLRSLHE